MNKAREIAERLFHPDMILYVPDHPVLVLGKPFNPYESWNDCGKVLEALLVNKQSTIEISVGINNFYIENLTFGGCDTEGHTDLKHAICEAFLSMEGV